MIGLNAYMLINLKISEDLQINTLTLLKIARILYKIMRTAAH
jgi:hypothetical protein